MAALGNNVETYLEPFQTFVMERFSESKLTTFSQVQFIFGKIMTVCKNMMTTFGNVMTVFGNVIYDDRQTMCFRVTCIVKEGFLVFTFNDIF